MKLKKSEKSIKKPQYYFGYKTDDNRFGDTDLSTPFIWKKKWEKDHPDVKGDKLKDLVTKKLETRQKRIQSEIDDVKKLRHKRQVEKDTMERMREDIQRQVEKENYSLLNLKEEQFHKEQVREGALVRIKGLRENIFDVLFKVALFFDKEVSSITKQIGIKEQLKEMKQAKKKKKVFDDLSNLERLQANKRLQRILELHSPYVSLSKFVNAYRGKEEVRKLKEEINKMLELGETTEFWGNVTILIGFFEEYDETLIKKEIFGLLSQKNLTELKKIKNEIKKKIELNGEKSSRKNLETIDFEYWQELMKFIKFFEAKEMLNLFYQGAIGKKMEMRNKLNLIKIDTPSNSQKNKKNHKNAESIDDKTVIEECIKVEAPIYQPVERDEQDYVNSISISSNEFFERLAMKRIKVLQRQINRKLPEKPINNEIKSIAEDLFDKESAKPLEEDEEVMYSKNVVLSSQSYWWQDKFRPRKPLYFNRIKTGYDWNQYNRSHYDTENPPAKIVQGYKFNIFYPDLIDIKTAPVYSVEEIPGDSDYVILKFKSGPPYEDIAFKVVNKEWNHDSRSGFRSTFSNGVLQLFFNFKRYPYRR